jgi:hypothetical protein
MKTKHSTKLREHSEGKNCVVGHVSSTNAGGSQSSYVVDVKSMKKLGAQG